LPEKKVGKLPQIPEIFSTEAAPEVAGNFSKKNFPAICRNSRQIPGHYF
jgi:hypothetical protein